MVEKALQNARGRSRGISGKKKKQRFTGWTKKTTGGGRTKNKWTESVEEGIGRNRRALTKVYETPSKPASNWSFTMAARGADRKPGHKLRKKKKENRRKLKWYADGN